MRYLSLIICSFLSFQLSATHIVGGEMNYNCLGDNQYEIILTVYRDCFNGIPYFDDPASIGIFDEENNLIRELGSFGQLRIPVQNDDTIVNQLLDPCLSIPPNICAHRSIYRDTIELPFREGGYIFAYQRCCRNQSVINLVDPLETGATFWIHITEFALEECNSSPEFNLPPPSYLCVNRPIDYSQAATDRDGDSLVYKLCTPFTGATPDFPRPQPPNNPPYDTVLFLAPDYSRSQMLGPGDFPFEVDINSGQISGTPMIAGQFSTGICIEEYRNGQLISRTLRDFQYNIGNCGDVIAAIFDNSPYCENELIDIENVSMNATDFEWRIDAPGFEDTVITTVDFNIGGLPVGNYNLSLFASRDTGMCTDTFVGSIIVEGSNNTASLDFLVSDCSDSATLDLIDNSIIRDTGFVNNIIELFVNDRPITSPLPIRVNVDDSIYAYQLIEGINGCTSVDTIFFEPATVEERMFCILKGESVTVNGVTYDTDGTFIQETENPNGCNSILRVIIICKGRICPNGEICQDDDE